MILRKLNDNRYSFRCPKCKGIGYIDKEQAEGKISIQCTNCNYHETKNWLREKQNDIK